MKVKVKFNDFQKCLMQTYSQLEKDGGVIVDAEPIECHPEWEKRLSEIFFTTYEGFLKREYAALSSKAILKDDLIGFIRNLLKEFAKDYGYKGWDVIEKKYGIED